MTLTLAGGRVELLDIPGAPGQAPLVLLHEGLGSVGLWRDFPNRLAAATGRRTIAFSRYGHGESDPPPRARTPAFMHEEALEVLPELLAQLGIEGGAGPLGREPPLLVGHSDGASIALIYAAHHPVQGVVAMAPHAFVEDMCLREIEQARDAYLQGDLRERMARHHRDPDAAFYGWNDVWLDPEFPKWDITDLINRIDAPLLLIQGEHDQYGTMAQLDAIEEAASGPVQRVHLDARHAPQIDQPQQTVDAITAWIRSLPARAPVPGDGERRERGEDHDDPDQ